MKVKTKCVLNTVKGGEHVMIKYKMSPFDLVMDRLMAYPKKAKYIQIDRNVLEDLLKEHEQIELENEEMCDELDN